jgi:S-adenosylmethionine synthetase
MNFFIHHKKFNNKTDEFVELKGRGHPDTLSDALAENLSINYSKYTLNRFGAILHHNFDKVGLLGGSSYVAFGRGYLTNPIRVLINGRISRKFADEVIPVQKLLTHWTKVFFKRRLPLVDVDEHLDIHLNLSNQSSPGKTYEKESKKSARSRWFEPKSFADLPELKRPFANDTSLGVGYAPFSKLERLVLKIEQTLNSDKFKKKFPWMGSDIKILGFRHNDSYFLTICVPQIANFVKSLGEYKNNKIKTRIEIEKILYKFSIKDYELSINTRDNHSLRELYLTATGSSIESGDEGLAGRGNRINGLISPMRPMSMEGSFGKNPVNHIGKVYYIAAFDIADKIYKELRVPNEVFLASQSGRNLLDPWVVSVALPTNFSDISSVKKLVEKEVKSIPKITDLLLKQKTTLLK